MGFTAADQIAIEQAIRDLATGRRVVRVMVSGKQMEYGQADLAGLRSLLNDIREEQAAAEPAPGYLLTRTAKGL